MLKAKTHRHRIILTLLLTVVGITGLVAQPLLPGPSVRCVDVDAAGQPTLTWIPVADPLGDFVAYEVYHSTNYGGPYVMLASIPAIGTATYTDVLPANNVYTAGVGYYFVATRSISVPSPLAYSDTVSPMVVTVAQNDGYSATITWNQIKNPNIPTSVGSYDIFREFPKGSGNIVQIGATPYGNEMWLDTIHICNDSASYYVQIADGSGCQSNSSRGTAYYLDTIPPAVMDLDSVSVGPSGLGHMGWQPHPAGDVAGYYIVKLNPNNSNSIIDTVWGRNNTWYQYPASNAANESETFAITAFDSCGNSITYNYSFHSSIFTQSQTDVCLPGLETSWSAYGGWGAATINYEVWYRELPAGPWIQFGTTSGLSTTITPIALDKNYEVMVRAHNAATGETSSSNHVISAITAYQPVQFVYLQTATVKDTDLVEVRGFVDQNVSASKYVLKRASSATGTFETIATLPAGGEYITFTDDGASVGKQSYYYMIEAVDVCDNTVMTSNIGRTILLSVTKNEASSTNTVKWNQYEDWAGGVDYYSLYRKVGDNGAWELATTINMFGPQNTYVDELAPDLSGPGSYCYQIVAAEAAPSFSTVVMIGNVATVKSVEPNISTSNVVCAYHEPIVYMPNAFVPTGLYNNVIKPTLRFVDVEGYTYSIYNKWGEVIFTTNNISDGWDGRVDGNMAKTDAYVYLITFKDALGEEVTRRGSLTLLK